MLKYLLAALFALLPLAAFAQAPTRFSVTVEGAGPDVIMIPGLTSHRRVWDQAIAGLGGRYRVHRIQINGFGGAPAGANAEGPVLDNVVTELHAYVRANRLERPILVGHSVGGLIALMLAQRHPDHVERALIVDALPFYGLLFGADATAASVEPRATALRDAILAMSEEQYRARQPASLAAMVMTDAERPRLLEDALASDRRVVARVLYEDMIADLRPALAAMRIPLTVAYAVNPFATEAWFGSLVRASYAGAPAVRLIPVEPSYHFIMLDQPERFQAILTAFLAGTAAR
jgi:pimeloyl-ACP methyl ester carboxylesterase